MCICVSNVLVVYLFYSEFFFALLSSLKVSVMGQRSGQFHSLSEVDHFYHVTAPYYSVIILLFAVARFLADYSLVFIHVEYLIFIESVFQ